MSDGTVRRLRAQVGRLAGVRVLVVGDVMLDRFVRGRVERISPEAPVPVVHVTGEDAHAGGAGNVAANVVGLGGRAGLGALVGRDQAGRELRAVLRGLGVRTDGLIAGRSSATTQKTRIVAHHQQVVRLDHEDTGTVDGAAGRRLRDWVLKALRRRSYDVLVVSDYAKGVVDPALLEALAREHERREFTWIIDPKHANFAHYRRASLVKPNRQEAAAASGVDIVDDQSLRRAGAKLLELWQCEAVLISLGEEGMALFQGRRVQRFPIMGREVFDVTGAGDTVIATCALALGAGCSLEDATALANHAAGVVVGKVGTATVSAPELRAALAQR
jgi:D-beta-D-heptose 7-phosphate kinase/D-beta-D-heptose 1-phosphate adenosyltransferase